MEISIGGYIYFVYRGLDRWLIDQTDIDLLSEARRRFRQFSGDEMKREFG
jgi:hypothetical protein